MSWRKSCEYGVTFATDTGVVVIHGRAPSASLGPLKDAMTRFEALHGLRYGPSSGTRPSA
jgi:hypothetical protein